MLRISPASDRLAVRFLRRGVPPPRLQRAASWIRPLSTVAPARGLDVRIYDGFPKLSLPSQYFGAWVHDRTGLTSARTSSGYVLFDV